MQNPEYPMWYQTHFHFLNVSNMRPNKTGKKKQKQKRRNTHVRKCPKGFKSFWLIQAGVHVLQHVNMWNNHAAPDRLHLPSPERRAGFCVLVNPSHCCVDILQSSCLRTALCVCPSPPLLSLRGPDGSHLEVHGSAPDSTACC